MNTLALSPGVIQALRTDFRQGTWSATTQQFFQQLVGSGSAPSLTDLNAQIGVMQEQLTLQAAELDELAAQIASLTAARLAITLDVDVGPIPVDQGRFPIVNPALTPTSRLLVWQAPGPYTGKGTRADESTMDALHIVSTLPGVGQAMAYWQSVEGLTATGRRGKVKGHVAFTYVIAS